MKTIWNPDGNKSMEVEDLNYQEIQMYKEFSKPNEFGLSRFAEDKVVRAGERKIPLNRICLEQPKQPEQIKLA